MRKIKLTNEELTEAVYVLTGAVNAINGNTTLVATNINGVHCVQPSTNNLYDMNQRLNHLESLLNVIKDDFPSLMHLNQRINALLNHLELTTEYNAEKTIPASYVVKPVIVDTTEEKTKN